MFQCIPGIRQNLNADLLSPVSDGKDDVRGISRVQSRRFSVFIKCTSQGKRLTFDDATFASRQFSALLSAHVFWLQMMETRAASTAQKKRVAMFLSQYAEES